MTKLGKGLWDNPAYADATIEPINDGIDLGTETNPFRNGNFSGSVSSSAQIIASISFSADPFNILADTSDGADTKSITIGGGGAAAVGRGAYIQAFGNEAGGADNGDLNLVAGNASGAAINVTGATNITGAVGITGALTQAGNVDITGTLALSSSFTYSASSFLIAANTADGSDNKTITIQGGGASGSGRGAQIVVRGNESLGGMELTGGAIPTGHLSFALKDSAALIKFLNNNALTMWSVNNSGQLLQDGTSGSDIIFAKATTGIQLQSGANGRTGTFTMNGASAVTVNNTSLAAGDQIIISRDTPAGTPGAFNLTARTNGTSFAVTGTAGDTSGMRYTLVKIN